MRFSFEYYDLASTRYCLSQADPGQVRTIMERLGQINAKTFQELSRENKVWHFHPVDWEKTREKRGFPARALDDFEPFQIALLGVNGQLTRMYGAYSANVFYVVWFDLHHAIWPSHLRNT